jgi:hypothetical protein
MAAARGPSDSVRGAASKRACKEGTIESSDRITTNLHLRTEKFKVIFATIKLIEADISFDRSARPWVTEIGVTTRYDGKAFAFWLP